MSRVGKMPVVVPQGVDVSINAEQISVKGSLGTLVRPVNRLVTVKSEGGKLTFTPVDESAEANAMSGTMRALVANMVRGVTEGFERRLEILGIGYRVQQSGRNLTFSLGYSHPIVFALPEGVQAEVDKQTAIVIRGTDKHLVGQTAAQIRALRRPDPYKGKGIRYAGEVVRKKVGKAGAK